MREIDDKIWAAIASFKNGNQTEAEKEQLKQWLSSDTSNQKILDLLQDNNYAVEVPGAENLKERIFESTKVKIAAHDTRRTLRLWQFAAAASLALLISVSSFFLFRSVPPSVSYIETKCPEGSRSTVTLHDGTVVELNSGSSLSYPSKFNGKERSVVLTGEAFFNVSHNKKKPFLVKAGDLTIKVLGTKFNVKAYKEDPKITATLLEGSIRVQHSTSNEEFYVLSPDQQAVLDKGSNTININSVKAELFSVWQEGNFYFDSESLLEISRKLEREFNIQIKITTPELEKVIFSGVFDKGESIHQILDMLRKYRNFNYRINNNNVELFIEK